MSRRLLTAGLACLGLVVAAPAAAQQQPGPEATVDVAAIPGVVSADAEWAKLWEGPMIVDGMTSDADGNILFAQEQSNSIIKVWPDGRWWVEYPFVAGAGSVSLGKDGTIYAADRSCTDPGLGLGANCTVPSKIVQLAPERKTIADKFADGKPLGRINDLAADGHGGAYYTQGGLFHAQADGTVETIVEGGNPAQGGVFTNGLVLSRVRTGRAADSGSRVSRHTGTPSGPYRRSTARLRLAATTVSAPAVRRWKSTSRATDWRTAERVTLLAVA